MEVKIKGIYKHYKGDYYLVEDICIHSDTLEKYVLYRSLYGEGKLWTRPYNSFVEKISNENQTYRFELQEIASVRN